MTPWAFSVRQWQFTLVMVAMLAGIGVAAWKGIPRAEDPTVTFPGANVVVAFNSGISRRKPRSSMSYSRAARSASIRGRREAARSGSPDRKSVV